MALTFNAIARAASFSPSQAFPLDARSYFESYELAVEAALTAAEAGTKAASNTVYYIGQTLVVNEGGAATLYIIQPDKSLKEVGSVPVGDGKSIEVVDGQIKLKGFGSGYYRYNAEVEGKYEFVEGEFKAGLQPQIVSAAEGEGFEIAWYEPNPTTVEGLQSEITALSGSVNALSGKVDTKANAADVYTKEQADAQFMTEAEVDARVNKVIADAVETDTIESLTQLVEYIAEHGGEAAEMAEAIEVIEGQLNGFDKTSGSVKQYVDSSIQGLNISDYAKQSDLNDLSDVVDSKANANNVYTKEEIDNKGFLVEHQNLDHKADKSYVDDLNAIVNGDADTEGTVKHQIKAVQDMIPSTEDINGLIVGKGYATVDQLNNAVEGKATEDWVNNLLNSYATTESLNQAIAGKATESWVNEQLVGKATEGWVNEQLKNYVTGDDLARELTGKATEEWVNEQLSGYVRTSDLPAPLLQSVSGEFAIDSNKQLSIASVNVNKLVQTDGEELILNGGQA